VRICHVAPELLPVPPSRGGAIERWIRDAAVRLAGRGHELHVISRDHGDGRTDAVIDNVRYHFIPVAPAIDRGLAAVMFRGWRHYRRANRLLQTIAPDVVHHHSRPAGLAISRSGAPRAAHVISLHSMDYGWSFGYAHWDRRLFNRGFAAAARVLAVSNFIRCHVEERYAAVRGKSATVYNGVDGGVFHPSDGCGETGSFNDSPILYVGRVEERKAFTCSSTHSSR
jgi:glycosyltransferase involved in cell wall biosynthesis